jgi:hypothetical protein
LANPPQRISIVENAPVVLLADGHTNACVAAFPPPPDGYIITGSITVLNSQTGSSWIVALGTYQQGSPPIGTTLTSTLGQNIVGPVQQFQNENLLVYCDNADALIPGDIYVVQFVGVATDSADTEIKQPAPGTQATLSIGDQQLIQQGEWFSGDTFTVYGIPNWARGLRIIVLAYGGPVVSVTTQVYGGDTNYYYYGNDLVTISGSAVAGFTFYGPIDSEALVTLQATGGGYYYVIAVDDDDFSGQDGTNDAPVIVAPEQIFPTVDTIDYQPSVGVLASSTDTAWHTLVPSPPAGYAYRIGNIVINNFSSTVVPNIEVAYGPAGAPTNGVLYISLTQNMPFVYPNGGLVIGHDTANDQVLQFHCSVAGNVYVSVTYQAVQLQQLNGPGD